MYGTHGSLYRESKGIKTPLLKQQFGKISPTWSIFKDEYFSTKVNLLENIIMDKT